MHEHKVCVRYLIELLGAFILYALVLVVSIKVGRPMPESIGRTLLLVSPMLPFLLVVWAVVRGIRRSDEYIRLQILEAISISAGVTAGWTFTYGFLENAGFPRLSMFNVMPVMCFVWAFIGLVRRMTSR
jgi:hypothetical protein